MTGQAEYYREMMAPKRALEQNSRGNWVSRYDAGRKADHYARAEVYCMLAGKPGHHADGKFLRPRLIDLKPRRGGSGWKWGLP